MMIKRKLITGAFLALCSTAAAVPGKKLVLRTQENVGAWLTASNAARTDEAHSQANEARVARQEEIDEILLQAIEDQAVQDALNPASPSRGAPSSGSATSETAKQIRAGLQTNRKNKTGIFDLDASEDTTGWCGASRTESKRETFKRDLIRKAAMAAHQEATNKANGLTDGELQAERQKQYDAALNLRKSDSRDTEGHLSAVKSNFETKLGDYSDDTIKANLAQAAHDKAKAEKEAELDARVARHKALKSFVDFTNLAKVPLFVSPRALMGNAAAWAVATRAFEDKMSIADAAKTVGLSLAGTTATALMITLSNYMKGPESVQDITLCSAEYAPAEMVEIPYMASNFKSNVLLALSAIPYLMGQNPEFTIRTFKTAKALGFKGSLEEMLKTVKTGFAQDGSAKDRAFFLARTFGPFLTGLVFNDAPKKIRS